MYRTRVARLSFLAGSGGSPRSSPLVVACGGIQERPREVVVKLLLGAAIGRRVEDAPEVFIPEVAVWRIVVKELVGDILGPLELYLVEPVGEHGQVDVEDNVVAPARVPAVNSVLVAVVGGELVCGMVKHPRVHVALACAVGVLVRIRLKVCEAQLQCSPLSLSCLFTCVVAHTSQWYHICGGFATIARIVWGIPALLAYRLPVWYHSEHEYSGYERPRGASE